MWAKKVQFGLIVKNSTEWQNGAANVLATDLSNKMSTKTLHPEEFWAQKWSLFHQDDHLIYLLFLFERQNRSNFILFWLLSQTKHFDNSRSTCFHDQWTKCTRIYNCSWWFQRLSLVAQTRAGSTRTVTLSGPCSSVSAARVTPQRGRFNRSSPDTNVVSTRSLDTRPIAL